MKRGAANAPHTMPMSRHRGNAAHTSFTGIRSDRWRGRSDHGIVAPDITADTRGHYGQ